MPSSAGVQRLPDRHRVDDDRDQDRRQQRQAAPAQCDFIFTPPSSTNSVANGMMANERAENSESPTGSRTCLYIALLLGIWSANYPTHTPPEPVKSSGGVAQAMPRRVRRPASPCAGRAPCARRDTHALRACSSDVRTPLITSVTVVLVVVYFSLRLTDLLRLGRLDRRLELGRVGALDLDPQVTVADRRRLHARATVGRGLGRRGRGRVDLGRGRGRLSGLQSSPGSAQAPPPSGTAPR